MSRLKQGYYSPTNPEKYKGDVNNIRFLSGWELSVCQYLDNSPSVISWQSEEIQIPYYNPIKKRMAIYLVDFAIEVKTSSGKVEKFLLEIKPLSQTLPPCPASSHKHKKAKLYEMSTWLINSAKWRAASQFAKANGFQFKIITEKQLGIK
jgi:hypothetical protein